MVRIFFLFIFSFFVSLGIAQDYELTLYTIPPRHVIDFASPRSMFFSAARNVFVMHRSLPRFNMGHVFIELKSDDEYLITGSSKERTLFLGGKEFLKGYGLGLLFHPFPGRLDTKERLLYKMSFRYHTGNIRFITFKLQKTTFQRLVNYLAEYKRKGYYRIYNGCNEPRKGNGAGCTAFAISFLEISGILQPEWVNAWAQRVNVPLSLIGGPLTGKKVSWLDILAARQWAQEGEAAEFFEIYDPTLIYQWIGKTWLEKNSASSEALSESPANSFAPMISTKRNKALGLIIDFSSIPTPEDPILLIDEE